MKMKLKKWQKWIIIVNSALVFVWTLIFISYLIPTPLSSQAPVVVDYKPITKEMKTSFVANFNNLKRIDLYLNNNSLTNKENFSLLLRDENGALVAKEKFSGLNVGFKSKLRVDLSLPIADSANQLYQLAIVPEEKYDLLLLNQEVSSSGKINPNDKFLEIGLKNYNDEDSLAFMSFYQAPRKLKYLIQQTNERFLFLGKQLWGLWLFLLIIAAIGL